MTADVEPLLRWIEQGEPDSRFVRIERSPKGWRIVAVEMVELPDPEGKRKPRRGGIKSEVSVDRQAFQVSERVFMFSGLKLVELFEAKRGELVIQRANERFAKGGNRAVDS